MRINMSILTIVVLGVMTACSAPAAPTATPQVIVMTATSAPATQAVTGIAGDDNTPELPPLDTPFITPTANQVTCVPDSTYVADMTIPDRTVILPGETFTKTWRMRNSGNCPWDHSLVFAMVTNTPGLSISPERITLPPTRPGEEVDISVTLTLASTALAGSPEKAVFQILSVDGFQYGSKPYVLIIVGGQPEGGTGSASLGGIVWLDYCGLPDDSSLPKRGHCIDVDADGIRQTDETGIADLLLTLHKVTCSGARFHQAITDSDGRYSFGGLEPGPYYVRLIVDRQPNNWLLPGTWTFPSGFEGEVEANYTRTLAAGQQATGLDFAWDPQLDY